MGFVSVTSLRGIWELVQNGRTLIPIFLSRSAALGISPWFGKSDIIGISTCYIESTWRYRFCARGANLGPDYTNSHMFILHLLIFFLSLMLILLPVAAGQLASLLQSQATDNGMMQSSDKVDTYMSYLLAIDLPSEAYLCLSIYCQHLCQIIIRRNQYMPTYKPPKPSRPEITKN